MVKTNLSNVWSMVDSVVQQFMLPQDGNIIFSNEWSMVV